MEKVNNKVLVRELVLFVYVVCLSSCNLDMQKGRYYQYYIGTMKIVNPVAVEMGTDSFYVCSDSILYCCNDSDWLCRDDVFPYIYFAEDSEPYETYFPRKKISQEICFQTGYPSFYEWGEVNGYPVYRFYFGTNTFECYMQASDKFKYCFDPVHIDVDIESKGLSMDTIDADEEFYDCPMREKEYRLVVRKKYNIFQILKLKNSRL